MKENTIDDLTRKLEEGVQQVFTSENYRNYLKVMSKFTTYSWSNSLLIVLQCPQASLVAGYKKWQEFHRHVKPGEKGIRIFAPCVSKKKVTVSKIDGSVIDENDPSNTDVETKTVKKVYFKAISVFDVSQTDGEPLPSLGVENLSGSVEEYQQFFDAIVGISDVPVRFDTILGEAKGYYSNTEKQIVLQSGMSELQTFKTAVHELAHSKLHDKDMLDELGIKKDRETKEVEAESVAYIVCQHFGLDTSEYSFSYIAGWSSGREAAELKNSLKLISNTAHTFIDQINAFRERKMIA